MNDDKTVKETDAYPVGCFENYFFVKKKNTLVKITIDDIQYISIDGRYSNIITSHGKYVVQLSLKHFLNLLPKMNFKRIHRNCIVNTNKVVKIFLEDNLILLEDDIKVNISRLYRQEFVNTYPVLT